MAYVEVEKIHFGDDKVKEVRVDALFGDGKWVDGKRVFQRLKPFSYLALSFLKSVIGRRYPKSVIGRRYYKGGRLTVEAMGVLAVMGERRKVEELRRGKERQGMELWLFLLLPASHGSSCSIRRVNCVRTSFTDLPMGGWWKKATGN